jgi:hypothetical protein
MVISLETFFSEGKFHFRIWNKYYYYLRALNIIYFIDSLLYNI